MSKYKPLLLWKYKLKCRNCREETLYPIHLDYGAFCSGKCANEFKIKNDKDIEKLEEKGTK